MTPPFASFSVGWFALVAIAGLAIGTVIRLVTLGGMTDASAAKRIQSLKTWWVVTIVVLTAALIGRIGVVAMGLFVSLLSLVEFTQLPSNRSSDQGQRRYDRKLLILAFALIFFHYLALAFGWSLLAVALTPLIGLPTLSCSMVIAGETAGFLERLGRISIGLILTAVLLGHIVSVFDLADETDSGVRGAGWFLYLIVLTELNDIAQALTGRRYGNRKLAPIVSPAKTWEGFLGGVVVTVGAAVALAPWLTSLAMPAACVSGGLIAVAGLLGDLNMSAIKRDVGVGESGHWLPGQGGLLDRVDSLMFTAPAFYYFTTLVET